MTTIHISMPKPTASAFQAEVKLSGLSSSECARRAIDFYVATQREARARLALLESQANVTSISGSTT